VDTFGALYDISAELIRPDPAQPRRVLPEAIHAAFHSDRLTPAQALRELIQIAQVAARHHGRPLASLIDLLSDSGEDAESEVKPPRLSPEEQLVRDLVNGQKQRRRVRIYLTPWPRPLRGARRFQGGGSCSGIELSGLPSP
jgi:hypothetical protein